MTDSDRVRDDVIWRMYCSGAMLHHVQGRYPALTADQIHAIILEQHRVLTSTETWYRIDPCVFCGDGTCADWGARIVPQGGWGCLACVLPKWLKDGAAHDLAALRTLAEEVG